MENKSPYALYLFLYPTYYHIRIHFYEKKKKKKK